MLTVGDLKELLNKLGDDYDDEPIATRFGPDELHYISAVKYVDYCTIGDYQKGAIVLQMWGSDDINKVYTKERTLGEYW